MEIWDYMDPEPSLDVKPFEGDSLEDIESKAKAFVAHIKEMPWSGTIRFIAIMNKEEAKDFIEKQIEREVFNWQKGVEIPEGEEDSLSFINHITKSYLDCYEN